MIQLAPADYGKVRPLLAEISFNTLFAQTIVEGRYPGVIYADQAEHPTVFYIAHPYGMSLLAGSTANEAFNAALVPYLLNEGRSRAQAEWLQVYPDAWNSKLTELLGDKLTPKYGHRFGAWVDGGQAGADASVVAAAGATDAAEASVVASPSPVPAPAERHVSLPGIAPVETNVRVNFRLDAAKYKSALAAQPVSPAEAIVPTTEELALAMPGAVTPRFFWRTAEDGSLCIDTGFTRVVEGKPASTAFASCRTERELEIGIETADGSRGHGYAFDVSAAFIDYCLEHGLEPVWACRLENEGSFRLARRLGFEPVFTLPYYRLPA
jgi:RimJ/RimL family protein N-acetyltransferase